MVLKEEEIVQDLAPKVLAGNTSETRCSRIAQSAHAPLAGIVIVLVPARDIQR